MADQTGAMRTRPLGAQISHMLKDRGVDVIFGIPGVHNQEMYRGIEEAGITHVLARHEQGAGFMADGYARATGRPGVAYVITGPGVCNIMTPMGQAYSDSVSVLVLSSCLDETAARRGQLHQMKDQEIAAGTVCDWSETALSANAAYALIDRALVEFETKRPRSKHIQVPIAQLEAQAPAADLVQTSKRQRPAPHADDVAEVAAMLAAAKKPMIVFGGGAAQASEAAREVLRKSGAASATSYAGRGIVGPDAPLHFGACLARADSAAVMAEADLVLAVGTELVEVDLWRAHLGHSAPMIRVDLDPEVLCDPQGASFAIHADANAFLSALSAALPADAESSDWTAEQVAAARARWRAETDAERPGIVPICDALRAAVPDDTMIYSDMTQFAYVAKEVWDMDRPGHWHHPYGFGTLGYATPAAIGGAVARRGQPTMAIIGDYGFHYTMQELGVAVELGLSLPIILWDNGKLKEIEDSMVGAQIAPNAVIAQNPDFVKLAEAFGARAVAPGSLDEMQSAVSAAFDANGPTLIYLTPALTA
ncbi:acetolactate synthase-1/2/3 large subunit/5-guanidino-2-oxopentanoate decarboxylase [Sulfitobacter mediterraneus]|uniref:Acetolactate synthase-1/2/3 large subunit/5-guanidino-2-oxopentanoate decarboxylase n=2 Tax=Sulfitobacter mediterraneus TaxID=83219 RepID=A0A2T6CIH2_9RHOB|nr:5-guanidino-2-oxopentanoate decarboxylase [Sulfitobacter mediterraneus]KIN76512.1 putative acetolactate synthase isozyme 1 large subunit [Sulfitobacter mediterraneus KCTC 32188]PTX75302.1 acetolactate synthase-1/2/3 large subunit/5-guanidino-2-oxopentanoate decarboxylase [Sulfitobacter mediterraneus]